MTATHTPGPWKISWYECKMNREDVEYAKKEGNLNAKVGDVLWRAPSSIGPCASEHSHWGGDLLTVEEADALLIAAAPELLKEINNLCGAISSLNSGTQHVIEMNGERVYWQREEWVRWMLDEVVPNALAAIAKATGETK